MNNIMIIGIPNAGKTTYTTQYNEIVHYDDISHMRRIDRLPIYAGAKTIEGIYNSVEGRKRILSVWENNTTKICIWLDTPVETCLERERNGRMRGDHLVLYHAKNFEPPTYDEGWDEIWIIKNDEKFFLTKGGDLEKWQNDQHNH